MNLNMINLIQLMKNKVLFNSVRWPRSGHFLLKNMTSTKFSPALYKTQIFRVTSLANTTELLERLWIIKKADIFFLHMHRNRCATELFSCKCHAFFLHLFIHFSAFFLFLFPFFLFIFRFVLYCIASSSSLLKVGNEYW